MRAVLLICMAHEIAKLMLEHAGTFLERAEAVEIALCLGMPLRNIEEYLDWLDNAALPRDGESRHRGFRSGPRRPKAG